jgi:hypothetical protein
MSSTGIQRIKIRQGIQEDYSGGQFTHKDYKTVRANSGAARAMWTL